MGSAVRLGDTQSFVGNPYVPKYFGCHEILGCRVLTMSAMERTDLQHPETWTMDQEDKNDVAGRCLAGLRARGIPATRVLLDPTKLKGATSATRCA